MQPFSHAENKRKRPDDAVYEWEVEADHGWIALRTHAIPPSVFSGETIKYEIQSWFYEASFFNDSHGVQQNLHTRTVRPLRRRLTVTATPAAKAMPSAPAAPMVASAPHADGACAAGAMATAATGHAGHQQAPADPLAALGQKAHGCACVPARPVSERSCGDVGLWLEREGLNEFKTVFGKHAVVGNGLLDLTVEDLKDMGITQDGSKMAQ